MTTSEKKEIFFSVIVPVYNTGKYLKQCIDSLLCQTYSRYEIILVNDGSTDNSGDICKDYQSKNPMVIKYIEQRNSGQYTARLKGVEKAKGEYIICVDSDDFVQDNLLQAVCNAWNDTQADIIIYQLQTVGNNGTPFGMASTQQFSPGLVDKEKIVQSLLSSSRLNSMCIKACRKTLFAGLHVMQTNMFLRHGEDLYLFLQLLSNTCQVVYLPETLYFYRINTSSVTHGYDVHYFKDVLFVQTMIMEFINQNNFNSTRNIDLLYKTVISSLKTSIQQISLSTEKGKQKYFEELFVHPLVKDSLSHTSPQRVYDKTMIILAKKRLWEIIVTIEKIRQKALFFSKRIALMVKGK